MEKGDTSRACQQGRAAMVCSQTEASFHIAYPVGWPQGQTFIPGEFLPSAHWVLKVFCGYSLVLCMRGNLEGEVGFSSGQQNECILAGHQVLGLQNTGH